MAEDGALEEVDRQLLDDNRVERDRIGEEIKELRERNERRKKEREEEEKRLTSERAAEDQRRKGEEEDRKRKKEEEEQKRRSARAQKMAEFEKYKTPQKANFVISKKQAEDGGEAEGDSGEGKEGKKSKEQLETEKRAILKQRIKPLGIDGFSDHQLQEKARELHNLIARLEGEKYDLERRFKQLQVEMMELAERARQANKVGKEGLKRIAGNEDAVDNIQTRFAGAPCKVEMFSKYERQKDKRSYCERKVQFTGPQFILPAERIKPNKAISWSEEGMPQYHELGGAAEQGGHAE